MHELDLETMFWRRLEPQNREDGPLPYKRLAGMVACGDKALCVFGGHGLKFGPCQAGATYQLEQGQCWTNELHVFDTEKGEY